MNLHTLRFDESFADAIDDGEKTITIRYDPGKELYQALSPPGSVLDMRTDTGHPIGFAYVDWRVRASASTIAGVEWDGHRDYDSVDELLDELSGYYPAAAIRPTSALTAVGYSLIDTAGEGGETHVLATLEVIQEVDANPVRTTVNSRTVADRTGISPNQAGQALGTLDSLDVVEKVGETGNNTYEILLQSGDSAEKAAE